MLAIFIAMLFLATVFTLVVIPILAWHPPTAVGVALESSSMPQPEPVPSIFEWLSSLMPENIAGTTVSRIGLATALSVIRLRATRATCATHQWHEIRYSGLYSSAGKGRSWVQTSAQLRTSKPP